MFTTNKLTFFSIFIFYLLISFCLNFITAGGWNFFVMILSIPVYAGLLLLSLKVLFTLRKINKVRIPKLLLGITLLTQVVFLFFAPSDCFPGIHNLYARLIGEGCSIYPSIIMNAMYIVFIIYLILLFVFLVAVETYSEKSKAR